MSGKLLTHSHHLSIADVLYVLNFHVMAILQVNETNKIKTGRKKEKNYLIQS